MLYQSARQDFLIRRNSEPVKILALPEDRAVIFIHRLSRRFPQVSWEIQPSFPPAATD